MLVPKNQPTDRLVVLESPAAAIGRCEIFGMTDFGCRNPSDNTVLDTRLGVTEPSAPYERINEAVRNVGVGL